VAWDHINVFPTFENYEDQFRQFIQTIDEEGTLIYYGKDESLIKIDTEGNTPCKSVKYDTVSNVKDEVFIGEENYKLNIIGQHNMQNMEAARLVCNELDISDKQFFEYIQDFKGAAKRLQFRGLRNGYRVYQDFAHAPSKVAATCEAVKKWFGEDKLYAFFELHTFSSLNKDFLPLYKDALKFADRAYVVYDEHTLAMKKMPELDAEFVKAQFGHTDLEVITDNSQVKDEVLALAKDGNLLMMSSGTFGGLDWDTIVDN